MVPLPSLPLVPLSRWFRRSCSEDYPSPQAMSTILCSYGTRARLFYSPGSSPAELGQNHCQECGSTHTANKSRKRSGEEEGSYSLIFGVSWKAAEGLARR